MAEKKKILLVSYIFPPVPGIGGRRWAKFAKYLTREGYEVHVICARSAVKEQSVWMEDIYNNEDIIRHEVKAFYPEVFSRPPRGLADKIFYRFWKYFAMIFFRGFIYDKSIFSVNRFVKAADQVIKNHNISKVVVSGAPFRLVYQIVRNRNRWPGIKLVTDMRDPWTWEEGGDYQKLNKRNLAYEKVREAFVVQSSDFISVPTLLMQEYISKTYPEYAAKSFVLSHAWDEDEIKPAIPVLSNEVRLILFGTLYRDLDKSMNTLAKAIADNPNVKLDIYSDSTAYRELFVAAGVDHRVQYNSPLPSSQLFRLISRYHASIIINNDSDKDHISTKFIELAASKTPVIYIAGKGSASDFVTSSGIGWHIGAEQISELLKHFEAVHLPSPSGDFNIDDFSFRIVLKQLLTRIAERERVLTI